MKWGLLVFALSAAACSFAGAGGPAGEGDADGGVDSAGSGSNANDTDNDGIANASDNCPTTANPLQEDGDGDLVGNVCDNCPVTANPRLETMGLGLIQRDHDGDGRGDECDLCPHIKSASDVDGDGDKIGAACDPDDAKKNPPAEFDGFYEAPTAARWMVPGGGGALADWELEQTADKRLWWRQKTLDNGRHQLIRNRADFKEVYVDSTFRIHLVQPAAGAVVLRSAAVTYGFLRANNADFYFNCGLRHDVQAIASTALSATYNEDGVLATSVTTWNGALAERDVHVIAESNVRGGGSRLNCDAMAADPATSIVVNALDSNLIPDGKVGLRTFGMTASFDYIFMVDKAVVTTAR